MRTKRDYQEWLDEIAPADGSEEWVIGGKERRGSYGAAVRRHDPIAFAVGFREWVQNAEFTKQREN